MKILASAAAMALAGAVALGASAAQAQSRGVAGTLTCNVAGGVGLILGSKKDMTCRFVSSNRRLSEVYHGSVTRVGLDIGVTGRAVIVWNVLVTTSGYIPGSLSGTYTGATADASLGLGAGAKVLVGGNRNSVSLQPVSLQAQTGVNLAVGIGSMSLTPVRSVIHSRHHR
ncbi:MAG TPA: DUF992 domain-containing protein [Hyphomicrobiales bacterium]|nr:DUF992 domain-containing protein [Hyphomicrobiales bacterium]